MDTLRHSGSIIIRRSPEELYDMVADVTRMGEWSPVCTACWWDEGDGPHVGAKFTGHNERPERTWETRSQVVTADRGRQFAWVVVEPPTGARWGYSFVDVDRGTEVTETWEPPPEGSAFFEEMFGDDAAKEIGLRSDGAKNDIGGDVGGHQGCGRGLSCTLVLPVLEHPDHGGSQPRLKPHRGEVAAA